jgi:hypothetical protein
MSVRRKQSKRALQQSAPDAGFEKCEKRKAHHSRETGRYKVFCLWQSSGKARKKILFL